MYMHPQILTFPDIFLWNLIFSDIFLYESSYSKIYLYIPSSPRKWSEKNIQLFGDQEAEEEEKEKEKKKSKDVGFC